MRPFVIYNLSGTSLEGLWQGPQEPRSEHYPDRLHDARRWRGRSNAVEGATGAKVLEAYVEGFLAPSLSTGHIVLLDNLGAHKTQKVRELIETRGAEVWFLPTYRASTP